MNGGYPLNKNNVWHTGVHLGIDDDIHAIGAGRLGAVRNSSADSNIYDKSFMLLEHQVKITEFSIKKTIINPHSRVTLCITDCFKPIRQIPILKISRGVFHEQNNFTVRRSMCVLVLCAFVLRYAKIFRPRKNKKRNSA